MKAAEESPELPPRTSGGGSQRCWWRRVGGVVVRDQRPDYEGSRGLIGTVAEKCCCEGEADVRDGS